MKRSRRKFLKLLAAGGAAVVARPAAALATSASAPGPARKPHAATAHEAAPPDALRVEIERQKKELAKTLKTLRDFPLEPGSDPAFVFAPMRAARGEKKS